MLEQKPHR